MYFPKFAGKSYEFIIFQGDTQKIITQGIIPKDGKFTLVVPEKYNNYIGMSRWLITGTEEGGGLDMFIPGHDFSVSSTELAPSDKNIVYTNNTGNNDLNNLYNQQEKILSRYQSMLMAVRAYDFNNPYYSVFKSEYEKQKNNYAVFQNKLRDKSDYINNLLSVMNITRGMAGVLSDQENVRGKDISKYVSERLSWNILYTSGHWSSVIEAWVSIHVNVLKDPSLFISEFRLISNKIQSTEFYSSFYKKVLYYLKQYGKTDYINIIKSIAVPEVLPK